MKQKIGIKGTSILTFSVEFLNVSSSKIMNSGQMFQSGIYTLRIVFPARGLVCPLKRLGL